MRVTGTVLLLVPLAVAVGVESAIVVSWIEVVLTRLAGGEFGGEVMFVVVVASVVMAGE